MNGTNGIISFSTRFHECMYSHYSWQIAAKKGEKVKLVIQSMSMPWWDESCTLAVEIQNGTYADGKLMSTRMCGSLLSGIVTFYSHEGQSLEVVLANSSWSWVNFRAAYTVISYNDTVSNGKNIEGKLQSQ